MKAVTNFILVLFFLIPGFYNPGYSSSKPTHSEHINVRRPAPDKIQKFQSDKSFNYDVTKREHRNLWQRFIDWLARRLMPRQIPGTPATANLLWTLLELLIVGAAIALFVYYILKGQGVSLFSKNSGNNLQFTEAHEDISQMNFEELIAKAAGSGQYRQAVRYLYLKSLKQLSDSELIKWKVDKTNRDYMIELRSSPFSKLFSEITLLFDYAWYGNAPINDSTFTRIQSIFEQFNRQAAQKS